MQLYAGPVPQGHVLYVQGGVQVQAQNTRAEITFQIWSLFHAGEHSENCFAAL
jgi:hypothetical protein